MDTEKDMGLHGPRLFLWNFSDEEKIRMDQFLAGVQAPLLVAIEKIRGIFPCKRLFILIAAAIGNLSVRKKSCCFITSLPKGSLFLIDQAKRHQLPRPIYAAVTEESIHWPFHELMEDLIQERKPSGKCRRSNHHNL